jgi:erythromycin esterase-like protein
MGRQGGLSVGQLARQRHGRDTVLVGLTTYTGTVTAASAWDAPGEAIPVEPAVPESVESLFHDLGHLDLILSLRGDRAEATLFQEERLERTIGAVHRPVADRFEPYFHTRLRGQFDVVIHLDRTTAVQPLDRPTSGAVDRPPEPLAAGA